VRSLSCADEGAASNAVRQGARTSQRKPLWDGWNLERELWADIWEHFSPHYDPYPHMEV